MARRAATQPVSTTAAAAANPVGGAQPPAKPARKVLRLPQTHGDAPRQRHGAQTREVLDGRRRAGEQRGDAGFAAARGVDGGQVRVVVGVLLCFKQGRRAGGMARDAE